MEFTSEVPLRVYEHVPLGIDKPLGYTRERGEDGRFLPVVIRDGARWYVRHPDEELGDDYLPVLVKELVARRIPGLSLASCKYVTDAGLPALLPVAPHLEILDLFNTNIADVAPLAQLGRLRALNLAGTRVVDLAPLRGLTSLEYLNLGFTGVGDEQLKDLPPVKTLDVRATRVTDGGMSTLAGMGSLETLILEEDAIGDDGLRRLAPLGKNLVRLHLGYTAVTEASVATLVEHFRGLRTLMLRATHLARDHDAKIKEALTALGGDDTGPDGVQEGLVR